MTPRIGGAAAAVPLIGLRRATRLTVIGLIAIAAMATWRWRTVFDPVAITSAIGHYPAAPLGFLAAHIAASLVFIPRTLLAIVSGLLFGAGWGVVWAELGSIAGAAAGFLLARYVSSGLIDFQQGSRVSLLSGWVERGGWRAVALLRLIPIMPHSVANYGLGVTALPLGAYAFGSLIGQLPLTIAYVELGAAGERLLAGGTGWIELTLIGFAALSLSLLFSAYLRRRSR
jgi:uncharacterized membrane protein YdjX (TVP38/TMEM64 family)